eukprot:s4202_g2.t1
MSIAAETSKSSGNTSLIGRSWKWAFEIRKGSSPESGQSPARDQFTASSPESQAKKVKGEAVSSPATDRRAWVSNQTSGAEAAGPGPGPERRKILLAKHEMIDFAKLTQKDCLGSGGFGAVYRGYFGTREVAIKKLFCEDGGNISPLQLEELEKEVVALRSLSHPRLVGFIGACLQPPNLCIVTESRAWVGVVVVARCYSLFTVRAVPRFTMHVHM